jgi:3-methyladenine DNA glycosylase AlkD
MNVDAIAGWVERELRRRARPAVAAQARKFFQQDQRVPIRGVRAAEVRRIATEARRALGRDSMGDLLSLAERLLASRWLEDKAAGIYAAAGFVRRFGEPEFRHTERWLRFISDWATNDGLTINVLGPQLVTDRKRVRRVFLWLGSRNRWHRRAAATSLIPAARRGLYTDEIFRLARRLYRDPDEMVQKGVGWLLKEASKTRRAEVVRFLLNIKHNAPRLVLRYASEKLPPHERKHVLA